MDSRLSCRWLCRAAMRTLAQSRAHHLAHKAYYCARSAVLCSSRTKPRSMATQALPEEANCFVAANRWAANVVDTADGAVPIVPVPQGEYKNVLSSHGNFAQNVAAASNFQAKAGEILLLPNSNTGQLDRVLLGLGSAPGTSDCWAWAALPAKLPSGTYTAHLPNNAATAAEQACLGWALGCYSFDKYKKAELVDGKPAPPKIQAKLVWPQQVNKTSVTALANAFFWARDMINTPAEDLGPGHLTAEAAAMAALNNASINIIKGDDLLLHNYPAIHTVGRAAARPPALVDIRWAPSGDSSHLPLVALVGKGVCFDSGGLDIKTAQGMKLMKKDMGGAALMLALGHVIMANNLPVRLRVMVPAVENAISGNAYRPLDVLRTRAGITVENGNTDAEGRLILSDALFEASSESPDVLIDAATLTGAARVALGPDVAAVFTNSDVLCGDLNKAAAETGDAVWRLPLHDGYRKLLDSKVADISSTGGEAGAGAVLAALFLREFAKVDNWMHLDIGAWLAGPSTGAGRPEGGEAQALRALWTMLLTRYATTK